MFKHGTLELHDPEEDLSIKADDYVKAVPAWARLNPITEYFSSTDKLKQKIIQSSISDDAEILGLFSVGIISAAEFYFRSVFGVAISLCPISAKGFEMTNVPSGAHRFYDGSGLSYSIGCLEHESLADAKKIKAECKRFTSFNVTDSSSASKAVDDFELLCELRHCLVHSKGYVGLKASKALAISSRSVHKVLLSKSQAFEVIKLSHNAVRAMNRFLVNSIANRWIDSDLISGDWKKDKPAFTALVGAFMIPAEAQHGANIYAAYRPFQRAAKLRHEALFTKA